MNCFDYELGFIVTILRIVELSTLARALFQPVFAYSAGYVGDSHASHHNLSLRRVSISAAAKTLGIN
jgi:hypothetical protein